jgi:hypothetical protein
MAKEVSMGAGRDGAGRGGGVLGGASESQRSARNRKYLKNPLFEGSYLVIIWRTSAGLSEAANQETISEKDRCEMLPVVVGSASTNFIRTARRFPFIVSRMPVDAGAETSR